MEQVMNIKELDQEEIQRLFELYQEECVHSRSHPSLSDFVVWLAER